MDNEVMEGESGEAGLPEDVARLYQWAGLRGIGYRDFSSERRSMRAGMGEAERDELRRRTAERWGASFRGGAETETMPGAVRDPYEDGEMRVEAEAPYTGVGIVDEDAPVAGETVGAAPTLDVRTGVGFRAGLDLRTGRGLQAGLAVPVLAVFSLAGGTGKTSLTATLGRALSSLGEEAELVETAAEGLLPFHFGTDEVRPGMLRTFAPPPGSVHAAVHLLSHDSGQDGDQDALVASIAHPAERAQRVLVDVNGASGWVLRRLAEMAGGATELTILMPVTPDLSSVLRLRSMEKYLHGLAAGDGEAILPYYVLNRFDEGSNLHREMRETLAGQLGDRLLPFAIREDAAVGEALGKRMTVIDLSQGRAVAGDYMEVARWLWESVPGRSRMRGEL